MAGNSNNNTFLQRSISTTGSLTNWTVSCWVKLDDNDTGTHQTLFSTYPNGGVEFRILNTGQLNFYQYNGGYQWNIQTNSGDHVFRDVSKWYHIVAYYDRNGQARIYVNGNQIGSSTISHNLYRFNQSGENFNIGRIELSGGQQYFTGSLAEFYFVDGLSLTPTVFAESYNNSWRPKSPPSIKSSISGSGGFGTNGFYLPFNKSSTALNDFGTAGKSDNYGKHLFVRNNESTVSSPITLPVHTGEKKYGSASLFIPSSGERGLGNYGITVLAGHIEELYAPSTRNWTIEYWAKIQTGVSGNYGQIIAFNTSDSVDGGNVVLNRHVSGQYDLYLHSAGTEITTTAGTGSGPGGWDHLVAHWSGTRLILFHNGTWVNSFTNITTNPFTSLQSTLLQLCNEADGTWGNPGSDGGNPAVGVIIDSVRIMVNGFPYLSDLGARPRNILNPTTNTLYSDTNSASLELALPFYSSSSGIDLNDYSGNGWNASGGSSTKWPWYTPVERQGAAYINGPFGTTGTTNSWYSPLRVEYEQHDPTKAFDLNGVDFTVEGWFFSNRTSNYTNLVGCDNASWEMIADWNSDGTTGIRLRRNYGTVSDVTFTVNTQYINKWCHFAICQKASTSTIYMFINGVLAGTTATAAFQDPTSALRIGEYNGATSWEPLNGGVSEVKVYKGYCKYTSAFTPSTTTSLNTSGPVPVVEDDYYDNLSLYLPLRQQWDTSKSSAQWGAVDTNDYSKYAHMISNRSSGTISPFLPTPTGAVYNDGHPDPLTVGSNSIDMSGDFTIAFWYTRSRPSTGTGGISNQTIISSPNYYTSGYNGNWLLRQHSDTELAFYSYDGVSGEQGGVLAFGSLAMGESTHVILCREGTTLRLFRDGCYCSNLTVSRSLIDQQNGLNFFKGNANSSLHGTISNFRIYSSAIVDHDNFTPGRITGNNEWTRNGGTNYYTDNNKTLFVLEPDCDGAPTDLTGRSAPFLAGIGSLSGDSKWRKSSYFLSQGYLGFASIGGNYLHPADNWTWECWIKTYITGERQVLWWGGSASGVDTTSHSFVEINAANQLNVGMSGGSYAISTNTFTAGTWYHIAVVKSSTTWKAYVNGTQWCTGTAPASNVDNDNIPQFGNVGSATTSYNFYGVLDSLRFTNDVLYTTSFTPGEIHSTTQYTVNGGTSYSNFPNGGTCLLALAPNVETVGRDESSSTTVSSKGFSVVNYSNNSADGGPQGSFATLNPLDGTYTKRISNNNLDISANISSNISSVPSTLGVSSGKWYAEVVVPGTSSNYSLVGLGAVQYYRTNNNQNGTRTGEITSNHSTIYQNTTFDSAQGQTYTDVLPQTSNAFVTNSALSVPSTARDGVIFSILLDCDSRTCEIKYNGKTWTGKKPLPFNYDVNNERIPGFGELWRYVAHPRDINSYYEQKWNFGQGFHKTNSGYTDENGIGNFMIKPPAGYLALNTANIYPEVRYYVTVSGGVFYLNGVANPAINLEPGYTYVFHQYDPSNAGHPLAFKDSNGDKVYANVTYYGEPGDNRSKATVRVTSTSTIARYYCTVHGNGMGNTITITEDTTGPTKYVKDPSKFFKPVIYNGDGQASKSITVGFAPDFVWIKDRTNGYHVLSDRVRGNSSLITSNSTQVELNDANTQAAFQSLDSNGFTVGIDTAWYTNRDTTANPAGYVAWCWNAGGNVVTNTYGTISSQVMANPACGFSIVEVNSTSSSNGTFGHGLGQAPEVVLFKNLTNAYNWDIYWSDKGYQSTYMLNSNTSASRNVLHANVNNRTLPFTQSYTDDNTIAYCFHSVPGISSMGTYLGNVDGDGPYIFCGFRPSFVMIKSLSNVNGNWVMVDSARDPFNPVTNKLYADTSTAENVSNPAGDSYTANLIDFLSTGFKLRTANSWTNAGGAEYLYIAFAESGMTFSNAR